MIKHYSLSKQLMEKGTKLVLEQVVTTIASVADTAEENFRQYYDRFMPCLMYIIENANSQELKMLRGKTIECVSLIGLAVGPDKVSSACCSVQTLEGLHRFRNPSNFHIILRCSQLSQTSKPK